MVCWSIGPPTFRSTTWDIHLGGPSEHCQEDLIARGPWDIIIDDGSHVPYHQVFSFFCLWKAVVPGGLYVIEDLETNYWLPGRRVYGHLGGTCESEFVFPPGNVAMPKMATSLEQKASESRILVFQCISWYFRVWLLVFQDFPRSFHVVFAKRSITFHELMALHKVMAVPFKPQLHPEQHGHRYGRGPFCGEGSVAVDQSSDEIPTGCPRSHSDAW